MAQYLPIVLLEFLLIAKDLIILEILGLSIVKNLSKTNGKLLSLLKYPAAEAQQYLGLRGYFSPTLELGNLGALSKALIRKQNRDFSLVLCKVIFVFGKQRAANDFIHCWQ